MIVLLIIPHHISFSYRSILSPLLLDLFSYAFYSVDDKVQSDIFP